MSTQYRYQLGGNDNNNKNPFSGLLGVAVAIIFFIALFYFLNFLFWLLWKILPLLVIATAIIDAKVILDFFGWLGRLFKRNWIMGLAAGGLTIIGAPVVAVFLLGRALLRKKIKTVQEDVKRQKEGEFVEYEEIDSEILDLPKIEPEPESRPEPEPEEAPKKGNDYEQLF
jgi:hypothetical protein